MTNKDEAVRAVVHTLALQSCIGMLSALDPALRERWRQFPDEIRGVLKGPSEEIERAAQIARELILAIAPASDEQVPP